MQIGLILLALAFPLLELAVLIKVGQSIGFWSTVLLLIAMGVLGGWLVQRQGLAAASRTMESMSRGEPPIGPAIDSMLIMLAGFLLLLPGLLTDIAGLLLLIPPVRTAFARWAVGRMLSRGEVHVRTQEWRASNRGDPNPDPSHRRSRDDVVIDGEWQRVDEPDPSRKGLSQGNRRPDGKDGKDGDGRP